MIKVGRVTLFLLLMVLLYKNCEALTTPVGRIHDVSEIRGGHGRRVALVSFSAGFSQNPQSLLMSIMTASGHALTASIPFGILNQISDSGFPGTGNLLPFIPAALATLGLTNNNLVPQLNNENFQIAAITLFQGTMGLTLSGIASNNHLVTANMTLSIHTPGEVLVTLPGVYLPVTFVINMQPLIPVSITLPPILYLSHEVNPLTGQLEPVGSF